MADEHDLPYDFEKPEYYTSELLASICQLSSDKLAAICLEVTNAQSPADFAIVDKGKLRRFVGPTDEESLLRIPDLMAANWFATQSQGELDKCNRGDDGADLNTAVVWAMQAAFAMGNSNSSLQLIDAAIGKKRRAAAAKGGRTRKALSAGQEALANDIFRNEKRSGVSKTAVCVRVATRLLSEHGIEVSGKTVSRIPGIADRDNA